VTLPRAIVYLAVGAAPQRRRGYLFLSRIRSLAIRGVGNFARPAAVPKGTCRSVSGLEKSKGPVISQEGPSTTGPQSALMVVQWWNVPLTVRRGVRPLDHHQRPLDHHQR